MPRLSRILSLDDFEPAARAYLPRPIFGYVSGAVEDNAALILLTAGPLPGMAVDALGQHSDDE